jgi:hypothetical protein
MERTAAATCHDDGKIMVLVLIAVREPAAVHDHRIVEQCAVAVSDRLELLEQVDELLDVILVDLRDLLDLRLVTFPRSVP